MFKETFLKKHIFILIICSFISQISCQSEKQKIASTDRNQKLFYQDHYDLEEPKKIKKNIAKNINEDTPLNSENRVSQWENSYDLKEPEKPESGNLGENAQNKEIKKNIAENINEDTPSNLEDSLNTEDSVNLGDSVNRKGSVDLVDSVNLEDSANSGDPVDLENSMSLDDLVDQWEWENHEEREITSNEQLQHYWEELKKEMASNEVTSNEVTSNEATPNDIALTASSLPISKPHRGSPGGLIANSFKAFLCRAKNKDQEEDFTLYILDYRVNTLGTHPLCEVSLINSSQTISPDSSGEIIAYAKYQRNYCDNFTTKYISEKKEHDCVSVVTLSS